nr:hypothetical protein [Hahella sp. KA22]
METLEEISGYEYDWLACDMQGYVALFTTAGSGYAPKVFLEDTEEYAQAIDIILNLPTTTSANPRAAARINAFKPWSELPLLIMFSRHPLKMDSPSFILPTLFLETTRPAPYGFRGDTPSCNFIPPLLLLGSPYLMTFAVLTYEMTVNIKIWQTLQRISLPQNFRICKQRTLRDHIRVYVHLRSLGLVQARSLYFLSSLKPTFYKHSTLYTST